MKIVFKDEGEDKGELIGPMSIVVTGESPLVITYEKEWVTLGMAENLAELLGIPLELI